VRRRLICAAVLCALLAAGCGEAGEETPTACLRGPAAYLEALGSAPGAVRLDGETPISSCLAEDQPAGDLARVGVALVAASTELNARGRARPAGPAPLRLGYLIGAVERGAAETSGIHADLVRRLSAAARLNPGGGPLPAAFDAGYRRGRSAGRADG
jgi:hypothetical protein